MGGGGSCRRIKEMLEHDNCHKDELSVETEAGTRAKSSKS